MALDKRVPELPLTESTNPLMLMVVYNPNTDITNSIRISTLLPTTEEVSFTWDELAEYDVDDIVSFEDQIWISLDAGNIGNPPGVLSDFWTIGVKGKTGLIPWVAGIYTETHSTVLKKISGNWGLYYLENATRPYNSSNFTTELAAGDWLPVGFFSVPDDVVRDRGFWDAASGLYPEDGTSMKNYEYESTTAGTVDGVEYFVGSRIRSKVAEPGQSSANWRPFFI